MKSRTYNLQRSTLRSDWQRRRLRGSLPAPVIWRSRIAMTASEDLGHASRGSSALARSKHRVLSRCVSLRDDALWPRECSCTRHT